MNKKDKKMKDNNNYVTRPKGKPESTTKGKLNEWANGYKEFVPQGQKPSNRTMLKQVGGSSFYKSEGTKESSYSLHLNVDAKDCEDPVAALHEQFLFLTEGEQKQKPQMPEGCRGQMLMDDGSVKIWLDSERGKLTIMAELECSQKIERQLLQAQAKMNVTVGRYRTEIINTNNK